MSKPTLSRSGATSPLEKNDRRIDIPISEELEDAIATMATLRRMPKSEFARMVLERSLFGEFSLLQKSFDDSES